MNWPLLVSIYSLIFLAELPDKTAFATLLLATRSRGSAVFVGVAAAFLIQTIVAVVFGGLISLLPEKWVHLGAGVLFLFFAVQMWRERNAEDECPENMPVFRAAFWPSAWRAFLVIFVAEWGDLTQIATASLIARYDHDKVTVFVAAILALWTVTLLAVVLGRRLRNLIHPKKLKTVCSVLFLVIGLYFIISSF